MNKKILALVGGLVLLVGVHAATTHAITGDTLSPFKVVSTSTITTRNATNSFQIPSLANSPCLTTDASGTFGSTGCGTGGGGSSTVILGVQGPTFTFSINNTSSPSSFTTSSANIFLNLLKYSSSSDITISSTGTIIFANHNISQFTNDSGYVTSSTAPVTSFNTQTGATSYVVSCVSGCTVATSTTSSAITVTGGSGAITLNSFTSSTFSLLGTANQITITQSPSGTLTFSAPQNLNNTAAFRVGTLGIGTNNNGGTQSTIYDAGNSVGDLIELGNTSNGLSGQVGIETIVGNGDTVYLHADLLNGYVTFGTNNADEVYLSSSTFNVSSTQFQANETSTFNGNVKISAITGTQCLHAVSGVVGGTGSDCGSGGGGIGPSTSTYVAVFNASGTITGYPDFTYNSSTDLFSAASGTFTNNFSLGTTTTGEGSVKWVNNGLGSFLGIYDTANTTYYGFTPGCGNSIANFAGVCGYYKGVAIQGLTSGGTQPIFGVLNSTQSLNGLGNTAFTIQDGNQVYTYNNTLDNGSGNAIIHGTLTVSSSISQAGGVNSIASTTINGNATTTNLTVTGVTNAIHVGGSGGAVTGYAGSSCTNQGVSGISATGTVTCTTFATSTGSGSGLASTTPWVATNIVVASGTGVATIPTSTLKTYTDTFGYATSTGGTATSSIIYNNVSYIPVNLTSGGTCGASTGVTDFGTCVNDIYASFASSSYNAIYVPPMNIVQANWATAISLNRNGVYVNLIGQGQPTIHYGGTGVAITINDGDPTGHILTQFGGMTLQGQSSLIAAGNANTATTTGIVCGGTNGCVSRHFYDLNLNGFGKQINQTSNAYMNTYEHVRMSGGNGGVNGDCFYANPASNSGEKTELLDVTCTDPGNSTTSVGDIYLADGANASFSIGSISLDDATIYNGYSNGTLAIGQIHIENPAYGTYGRYIPIYATSSAASTIDIQSLEIANDTSGANGFDTIIKHGQNLRIFGWQLDNYGNGTPTYLSDHSLNNGSESELICGGNVSGGGLTNIVSNQAYSQAVATNCVSTISNSYPFVMYIDGGNTVHIRNGNGDVATVTNNGAWTFSNNGTNGSVTIIGSLSASTNATIGGTLNATGTITQAGVPVGFGTVTTSSAGTANTLPIWTSGSALGNSHESESGTSTFINASATYIGSSAAGASSLIWVASTTTGGYWNATGTIPTLSSCGTSPTSTGNQWRNQITVGSTATGCVETFPVTFVKKPSCIVENENLSITSAITYSETTTTLTIAQGVGLGGDILDVSCVGQGE